MRNEIGINLSAPSSIVPCLRRDETLNLVVASYKERPICDSTAKVMGTVFFPLSPLNTRPPLKLRERAVVELLII